MSATRDHVDEDAGTVTEGDTASMLRLRDVDSDSGEVQVFDDCSLHIDADEIGCLIGPNSADKSTVLKTALGMVVP